MFGCAALVNATNPSCQTDCALDELLLEQEEYDQDRHDHHDGRRHLQMVLPALPGQALELVQSDCKRVQLRVLQINQGPRKSFQLFW